MCSQVSHIFYIEYFRKCFYIYIANRNPILVLLAERVYPNHMTYITPCMFFIQIEECRKSRSYEYLKKNRRFLKAIRNNY